MSGALAPTYLTLTLSGAAPVRTVRSLLRTFSLQLRYLGIPTKPTSSTTLSLALRPSDRAFLLNWLAERTAARTPSGAGRLPGSLPFPTTKGTT